MSELETMDEIKTYDDLRDGDVIVDKAGNTWLAQYVGITTDGPEPDAVTFWLCTIPANVRTHMMTKPAADPVTIRRPVSHVEHVVDAERAADLRGPAFNQHHAPEAVAIEADIAAAVETLQAAGAVSPDAEPVIEATATELDGIAAAELTGQPIELPAFVELTPLEARTHLYLLHGVYGHDVPTREGLADMHDDCHRGHDGGTLQSKYVAHTHRSTTGQENAR